MLAPSADDLAVLATNLTRRDEGVWYAHNRADVDYPDEGNAFCFQIEDASFWFRHRNSCIVEAVRRYPPSGAIADIGAGNGFVARALEQSGFPTLVVEPGASGIRNARNRGLTRLVCAAFEDVRFRPGSLPAAGLFDVLEHVADDVAFLRTVRDALPTSGRLYLTVPAYQALWSAEDVVAGHHRRYTMRQLRRTVRAAGFEPEFGSYVFSVLPLPILLFRAAPYRLRQTHYFDPVKAQASLAPRPTLASRLLGSILRLEAAWLRRSGRLPCGSSVLMVAARRA